MATEEDMSASIHAMGFDLLFWVQEIHRRGLFADDARVMALTSEGSARVWPGYGPVSAAKATLEAVVRSIAFEFAPFGIKCNVLQPGVTDTPALRVIPGAEAMMSRTRQRNPMKRLTRPEDVANVVALLSMDEASWINGACLRVDGGEFIVA
jgi:NAD(P)-dependent dehydrogenase (short-subunit alcohol dehydrogenase family)